MKLGMNLLLWTTHVTDEHRPLLDRLREMGYDGVEVPVLAGDVAHYGRIGQAIADAGLGCTAVTVIPDQQRSPISPEPADRQAAVDYLGWAIDCSDALGADVLCGPLYQPLGGFSGQGPTAEELDRAADVLRQVADRADQAGVTLAVEYVARFYVHLLTSMAETAALLERVAHPRVMALYDTHHANVEEKDPVGAIRQHGRWIGHFHVSENDRGTPGAGHIDFPAAFRALHEIGYDGWLTVEAFGRDRPDWAAATQTWRDYLSDPDALCRDSARYIREQWSAAASAGR